LPKQFLKLWSLLNALDRLTLPFSTNLSIVFIAKDRLHQRLTLRIRLCLNVSSASFCLAVKLR
jgi:hypothetical protein